MAHYSLYLSLLAWRSLVLSNVYTQCIPGIQAKIFGAVSVVTQYMMSLRWRHNEHDGVSNHQPHDCLLKHLFRRRSKETSKLRVTSLWVGNSLGTSELPAQRPSNAENVSIWWLHHIYPYIYGFGLDAIYVNEISFKDINKINWYQTTTEQNLLRYFKLYELVQERWNSSALAIGLHLCRTNPSICPSWT